MNDEIKKILLQSVRILRAKGGINNEEVKPIIISIEKLIRKRRFKTRIKKAAAKIKKA